MSFLTGYSYRKSITLARASGSVTNYQMRLLVGESSGATGEDVDCEGKCLSSFDDLRFTTSDGTTLLDYWIESITGTTPNQLATVWIEFDSIDTSDTIFYMYYGNSEANAYSNGSDTFLFFDDFEGSSIDTGKWSGDTGSATVSSSICSIVGGASSAKTIYSPTFSGDIALRAKAKLSDVNYTQLAMSEVPLANNFLDIWSDTSATNHSNHTTAKNSTQTTFSNTAIGLGSYHIYDMVRNLSGTATAKTFTDGVENGSGSTTNVPTVDLAAALRPWGTGNTQYCDWILVRKYLTTEPAWGAWGSEESNITGYSLSCGSGSFSLSGNTIDLSCDRNISINSGAIALTGTSINLRKNVRLITTQPVNITGVTLSSPTGVVGNYALAYTYELTGYDTWTCDGVEYQGKIYEFGPGKTYEQFYQASISAGVYNPKLLLFYPGDYYGRTPDGAPLSLFHGDSNKFVSWFVRGVGPIEDIIMHGSNQTIMAGAYSNTVIEGIAIKQTDYYSFHGYPIFCSGNYVPSAERHIYNKCLLLEQQTTTHFEQAGHGILDIRYCSILTSATTSLYFQYYSPYPENLNDNTLSSVLKTYFVDWSGVSGGRGLPTLDYVTTPTIGYGHEYGDYLISDWQFDGTKTLSWGGGPPVTITADGNYTLSDGVNTVIATVDYSELPATNQSDTITIFGSTPSDRSVFLKFNNINIAQGTRLLQESILLTLNVNTIVTALTSNIIKVYINEIDNVISAPTTIEEFNALVLSDPIIYQANLQRQNLVSLHIDVTELIKKVINLETWSPGNSLMLVLRNDDPCFLKFFDISENASKATYLSSYNIEFEKTIEETITFTKVAKSPTLTDFTTFTKVGYWPSAVTSVTSDRLDFSSVLTRFNGYTHPDWIGYFYKDYGEGFFGLNFIHEFSMPWLFETYAFYFPYSICNAFRWAGQGIPQNGIEIDCYKGSGVAARLRINFASPQVDLNMWGETYVRVTRNLDLVTVETFREAAKINLIGTTSYTIPANETYRYMYIAATGWDDYGIYQEQITGHIQNIYLYDYALSWNGGTAVAVTADGNYTLTSGGNSLVVDVQYASLPYSEMPKDIDADNSSYIDGVKILSKV